MPANPLSSLVQYATIDFRLDHSVQNELDRVAGSQMMILQVESILWDLRPGEKRWIETQTLYRWPPLPNDLPNTTTPDRIGDGLHGLLEMTVHNQVMEPNIPWVKFPGVESILPAVARKELRQKIMLSFSSSSHLPKSCRTDP